MSLPRSPAPGTAAARSRSPSPTRTNGSSTNGKQSVKTKLQLVDLAGSECVGKNTQDAAHQHRE